jgi:hypothetical protein
MLGLSPLFDNDRASSFQNFVPLPEEVNIAKGYDGDFEELDDASKFIFYFADMPIFEARC